MDVNVQTYGWHLHCIPLREDADAPRFAMASVLPTGSQDIKV